MIDTKENRLLLLLHILLSVTKQRTNKANALFKQTTKYCAKIGRTNKTRTIIGFKQKLGKQVPMYETRIEWTKEYKDWEKSIAHKFEDITNGKVVRIGVVILEISKYFPEKHNMFGKGVFNKCMDSFYYNGSDKDEHDTFTEEQIRNMSYEVGEELVQAIGYELKKSKLSLIKKTIEFNSILEGK